MIQDRIRRKAKRPIGNGKSPLALGEISSPEIDEVLAKVDDAIETAKQLVQDLEPTPRSSGRSSDGCTCW
jgi:hypothetical protein